MLVPLTFKNQRGRIQQRPYEKHTLKRWAGEKEPGMQMEKKVVSLKHFKKEKGQQWQKLQKTRIR